MKNTLALVGAIVVAIGAIAAAAIIVKKYTDKLAEKKKKEEEDCCCDCDGACCDLGFDDEEEINWEDIPVEDDDDLASVESIDELNDLDGVEEK